jgi:hypothetical protein
MILIPAYGRDYISAEAVKADWDANKDFLIADVSNRYNGMPINKQDAPKGIYNIRYNKRTQVCVVTVKYVQDY